MFSPGLRHICLSSPHGHSQAPLSGKAQPGRHMQSFTVTKLTGILKLIQSGDIAVKQRLVEKPLAECWISVQVNTDAWLTTHWKNVASSHHHISVRLFSVKKNCKAAKEYCSFSSARLSFDWNASLPPCKYVKGVRAVRHTNGCDSLPTAHNEVILGQTVLTVWLHICIVNYN